MRICLRCGGARWVCKAHGDRLWTNDPQGCRCGTPSTPCPLCKKGDQQSVPELPTGFIAEAEQTFDLIGFDEHETQSIQEELARLIRQVRRQH